MRLLVTGGTGGFGRALRPLAQAAGHEIAMPGREELDLFNPADAGRALVAALLLPSGIYNVCREEELSRPSASPGPPKGTPGQ
jgi:dTDP-4-dehydrorhamnose reductase